MPKYDASDTRVMVDDEVLSSDEENSAKNGAEVNKDSKKEIREPLEWERVSTT